MQEALSIGDLLSRMWYLGKLSHPDDVDFDALDISISSSAFQNHSAKKKLCAAKSVHDPKVLFFFFLLDYSPELSGSETKNSMSPNKLS